MVTLPGLPKVRVPGLAGPRYIMSEHGRPALPIANLESRLYCMSRVQNASNMIEGPFGEGDRKKSARPRPNDK